MRLLQGHRWAVRVLAFAPDDPTLLVSAGDDRRILVWDTISGAVRETLNGHGNPVVGLAFHPGERTLWTADSGGVIGLWSGETTLAGGGGWTQAGGGVTTLAVAQGGTSLWVGRRAERVRRPGSLLAWTPFRTGRAHWQHPWPASVEALAAADDRAGACLAAVASADCRLAVVEVDDHGFEARAERTMKHVARALAFAPGAAALAVSQACLVDLRGPPWLQPSATLRGHRGRVQALAFTPDGCRLLSGAADGTVRLWDAAGGPARAAWHWEIGPINALAVAPDGLTAAAGGDKNAVVVWDLD